MIVEDSVKAVQADYAALGASDVVAKGSGLLAALKGRLEKEYSSGK
jgi:hypothetical protein